MHARTHVYICISIILLFNILIKNRLYNRYIFFSYKNDFKTTNTYYLLQTAVNSFCRKA